MNVFVADNVDSGFISDTDYHWCDNGDLLMFGQFQLGNGNPSEVSMCGINSRCFTTNIVVKDLDISEDFYLELLSDSIEKSMGCNISRNGDYVIDMAWGMNFNVKDIMADLITQASKFSDGDKVFCDGIKLYKKQ